MIKLKPIAEQVLTEAGETVTWGTVMKELKKLKGKQNTADVKASLVTGGKLGLSLIPGVSWIQAGLTVVDSLSSSADLAKAVISIGKNVSNATLKNPKDSNVKKLTGKFWTAITLSPKVSELLDDKMEVKFINQVLVPELSRPGSENEPLPNMDELLGKWLNDNGALKQDADIHFKGTSGDL